MKALVRYKDYEVGSSSFVIMEFIVKVSYLTDLESISQKAFDSGLKLPYEEKIISPSCIISVEEYHE